MNSLTDSLYNEYSAKEMANELWKSKDAGSKKFVVVCFLFKIDDSTNMVS